MALQKASIDAFNFTAAANTTTTGTLLLGTGIHVRGFQFLSDEASLGDFVKIEIVDIDNVLGAGANVVLHTPIKKYYVHSTANSSPLNLENPDTVKLPASGLYVRMYYTNTSPTSTVDIYLNLKLFEEA